MRLPQKGVTSDIAERGLSASLDRQTGENHKAKIDKQALIVTIELRQEFNGFTAPLGDINQLVQPCENCLYDDRFWKAAIGNSNN
ncbi:MAG: hypothetical protein QOG00_1245 [Pyrinomonadaceae bacterium]|nr:hypothetical protein [Pyrinomonadaceae bacterium]